MPDASLYEFNKGNGNENELFKYKECFEKNNFSKDIKNLNWLHKQNVAGENIIYYAIEKASGSIAAIYTALPIKFKINNEILPAIQSIDTLTDSRHRGKGLFIKLANQLYQDARQNNFELVYGFPNDNSAPGFFKKLDWISFGEVPFLIKPLRLSYFIKKIFKAQSNFKKYIPIKKIENKAINEGLKIIPLIKFENDYDQLWKLASEKINLSVNRDSHYMNWRYITKPGEHYYKYGLYKNDNLQGLIVFTLKKKHEGLIGYLMEIIYAPEDMGTARQLLTFAKQFFKQQKADAILAWCLPHSYNFKAFKKGGYLSFSSKLRPQKLFFGVRALNKKNQAFINNINNWYISYSDSDTV